MLNKNPLRGHTKGEWKRFEYKLGSSRIYVEEPRRELIADVHKNRGAIDADGAERPDDEIVTVYNKCDSDLFFSAPQLLAEHDALCELVKSQSEYIAFLEKHCGQDAAFLAAHGYHVAELEFAKGEDHRSEITILRGRLSI